jgi:leucyl-tRNA synthetase
VASERRTIVVQIDGVVRDRIEVDVGADEQVVRARAERRGAVASRLAERSVERVVFVRDRLINFVTRS